MVIVKLKGGLGNQMFQYAIAKNLALKNQTYVKFDIFGYERQNGVTPRNYGLHVFCVEELFATKREVKFFFINRFFSFFNIFRKGYLGERVISGLGSDVLDFKGDAYLDGYWQSEKYFKDIRLQLLADFSLRDLSNLPNDLLEKINKTNSVSLHIRRGDYVTDAKTNAFHGVCGLDYYQAAMKLIKDRVSAPVFFVFSDDIDWAKDNLKGEDFVFVSRPEIKDYEELILMSKCKHNVIANSSFSWWGAWLNNNPDKIVIAPKRWFGGKEEDVVYNDIVPSEWLRV